MSDFHYGNLRHGYRRAGGKLAGNTVVGTKPLTNLDSSVCEENGMNLKPPRVVTSMCWRKCFWMDTISGGEQSGHVIFSGFLPLRAMAQLTACQLLGPDAAQGRPSSPPTQPWWRSPDQQVSPGESWRFHTDHKVKAISLSFGNP